MKQYLSPDQKREYLRILLTEGRNAAATFLSEADPIPGVLIFRSAEELEAFNNFLVSEEKRPDTGSVCLLPDNGRDLEQARYTVYDFIKAQLLRRRRDK